jgi:hypothetical protein
MNGKVVFGVGFFDGCGKGYADWGGFFHKAETSRVALGWVRKAVGNC